MTGFPINPPNAPMVDPKTGLATREWYKFFRDIQKKIGGPSDPFDDSVLLSTLPDKPVPETGLDVLAAPPAPPPAGDDPLVPPAVVGAAGDDQLLPYDAHRQVWQDQTPAWADPSGTLARTTFAAYAGQDVSAAFVEAEVQAIDDAVKAVSQRLAALITDLRATGALT